MNSNRSSQGKTWPQFLVTVILSIVYFTTGLHTGWPAPSIPKLLSEEYPFNITEDEASYITIIGLVGNVCGGFGNLLSDKFGRKNMILFIAIPQILSFFFIVMSYEVMILLYIGRFFGGVGEGMAMTIVPIYTGEIADPKIRGLLGSILATVWYFGVLFANIVGSYVTIKTTAMSFIILPFILVITFWKMPETPYFLYMKDKQEEAEKVLRFLRWKKDVSEEAARLRDDVKRQLSETGTFFDIFTINSNRKALLISMGARFFQICTGVGAFSLYIQVLLNQATNALASHIGATIFLSIQVFMTVISIFIIDKWGRKPLLLFSICGCFLDLSIQTVYFTLKDYTSVDVSLLEWFPLLMMILHIILYSAGLGVVTTIMISEMFSASVKPKLMCLNNAFYAIGTLCSTKFYQIAADSIGLVVPFATYGGFSFLGVFFFWFFVPETKGKTLEQIQQNLKRRKNKNNVVY